MSDWYQWDGDDLILRVRIQPRASRDEFVEPMDDAYKIRIKAPPVDGKANSHLIAFLAKQFGISKGKITLENGLSSRIKRLRIQKPSKVPLPLDAN